MGSGMWKRGRREGEGEGKFVHIGSLESFRTGDDFDQLGGDGGLAAAVVLDGQLADQIAGIARGIVHVS